MKKNARQLQKQKAFNVFLKKLSSPSRIQDYLDSIPFNFEKAGETCMSPERVFVERKAHCIEGAMLAACALTLSGERPLLMSLKVKQGVGDDDHVVALYKRNGYWGAVSKTNHAVLRFRDPVYKTLRELALSYFHEYFLVKNGTKTLVGYSRAINLNRFGSAWKSEEKDLWEIAEYVYDSHHTSIIPKINKKFIRNASALEQKAAKIPEYKK